MTESDSERIEHYLLGEMSESEREKFEGRFIEDDDLFYAVADRENELVDLYARRALKGEQLTRFENTLKNVPARLQKVENAKVLQEFIRNERKEAVHEERTPWYERLGFAFRMPAFATAALGMLLLGTLAFLLVENRSLNNQVADLLKSQSNSGGIEELRRREAELQSQLDSERSVSGDLTGDLENERENRAKLETELAELRKKISNSNPPDNALPVAPTIATLILRPTGIRGGPNPVRRLSLSPGESRISVVVVMPGETNANEVVSVQLNGKPSRENIRTRTDSKGTKSISFTLDAANVPDGTNRLAVLDKSGSKLAEHVFIKGIK